MVIFMKKDGVIILIALTFILCTSILYFGFESESVELKSIYDEQTVLSWDIDFNISMYQVIISNSPDFGTIFFNKSDINEYNYPEQVEIRNNKMYFVPYLGQRISNGYWKVRPYVIENSSKWC